MLPVLYAVFSKIQEKLRNGLFSKKKPALDDLENFQAIMEKEPEVWLDNLC